MTATGNMYHEKQRWQLCAVHAINNVLQDPNGCSKEELDQLCKEFAPDSWINPHKSMLGLGNYDVNVVMACLDRKGYDVIWYDKRKPLEELSLENVVGVILNRRWKFNISGLRFSALPFNHWYGARSINGEYYNLDSKLQRPEHIGTETEFRSFIERELADVKTEMLLVKSKQE